MTIEVMEMAASKARMVSFDLNYRSKLWSVTDAKRCYHELLPHVNVLITNRYDCATFFDLEGTEEDMAHELDNKFGMEAVAFTRSGSDANVAYWGSSVWFRNEMHSSENQTLNILDRFGAGDAFTSGLLIGLINEDPVMALNYGNAMAVLSQTTFGDLSWIRQCDLDDYFARKDMRIRR